MKNPKKEVRTTIPLKDNLKQILIKHFFLKVLEVEFITILVVVVVILSWGIYHNHQVNRSMSNTLTEIMQNYDDFLTALCDMDNVIVPKTSTIWRHNILKKFYETSFKTKVSADFYILDKNRQVVASNREYISAEEQSTIFLQWEIIDKILQDPQKMQVSVSKGKEKNLFLGKVVENRGAIAGYLVLQIEEREFKKIFSEFPTGVVIAGQEYWTVFSNTSHFVDNIGRLNERLRGQSGIAFFKGGIYAVSSFILKQVPLQVYTMFDYTEIMKLLLIVLLTSLIILAFLFWIGRTNVDKLALDFTRDIRLLNQVFLEVTSGNLEIDLDIHSSEEWENISQGFNEMLESLKKQMTKNRELAEMVAYEQIKQLKSQFKSHFLFNTLDNIRFICRISPELAESMIVLLSKLLRYHAVDRNEKVSLQEDLEYLKMYFEIIKIRFGDAFHYSIEIDQAVEECLVLKQLLQPLVENAIKYGFEWKEKIEVMIRAEKVGDEIHLICRDTGPGMAKEILRKIQKNLSSAENKTAHLGLYNVNRRVQLTYGSKYGLFLENESGVIATIKIPIEKD
ncbi:hypothetical protein EII17_10560 [Clostridiales bacterium COT073_COT-073]|nr:hypothetical protein EII17_10560 [Clostridiales bacterium COT073_COT-073]